MTAKPYAAMDDDELRHVGLTADALLALNAARLYGLMKGGPPVVVERCEDAIAVAHERGLTWTDAERTASAITLVEEWNQR